MFHDPQWSSDHNSEQTVNLHLFYLFVSICNGFGLILKVPMCKDYYGTAIGE